LLRRPVTAPRRVRNSSGCCTGFWLTSLRRKRNPIETLRLRHGFDGVNLLNGDASMFYIWEFEPSSIVVADPAQITMV
jgi:hypothetical protein